uniref:Uncharacterized protein n=1 Tax=Arundo donax TaxID=35708 RepID=A0A0A8Y1A2_ARUDO
MAPCIIYSKYRIDITRKAELHECKAPIYKPTPTMLGRLVADELRKGKASLQTKFGNLRSE